MHRNPFSIGKNLEFLVEAAGPVLVEGGAAHATLRVQLLLPAGHPLVELVKDRLRPRVQLLTSLDLLFQLLQFLLGETRCKIKGIK